VRITAHGAPDLYDLSNAYDDVVAEHAPFDVLSLPLAPIPGFVLWLLMVLNQKRMVEHLLGKGAEVNTASDLIDR